MGGSVNSRTSSRLSRKKLFCVSHGGCPEVMGSLFGNFIFWSHRLLSFIPGMICRPTIAMGSFVATVDSECYRSIAR